MVSERRSPHRTQWAAQFAVASELCKRGYQVAFTMGNHPAVDLMVISPKGTPFSIDVKGLYKRTYWVARAKAPQANLFYVFAFVPDGKLNKFFILTQAQCNAGIEAEAKRAQATGAKPFSSVAWAVAEPFEDKWESLPP